MGCWREFARGAFAGTLVASVVALTAGACTGPSVFGCEADDQCGGGTCEAIGYCSIPDDDCASGARYDANAGDGFAGLCTDEVPTGDGPGSGGDGPATTSGGGTTGLTTTSTTTSGGPGGETGPDPTGIQPVDCTPMDSATVALFRMDDLQSGGVTDATGEHVGGFEGLNPAITMGPQGCGEALEIAGMAHAVIPDSSAFQLAEGSVDLWVRLPPPPTGQDVIGLLSRDAVGQLEDGHFTLLYAADGRLFIRQQTMVEQGIVCTEAAVPPRTWVHVGINFGAPGLELYIDGMPQAGAGTVPFGTSMGAPSFATCGVPLAAGIDGNTNPWVVGASAVVSDDGLSTPVKDHFEGGAIDELRISSMRRSF